MAYDPLSRSTRVARSTFLVLGLCSVALSSSQSVESIEAVEISLLGVKFNLDFFELYWVLSGIVAIQYIYMMSRIVEDLRYPAPPEANISRIEKIDNEVEANLREIAKTDNKIEMLEKKLSRSIPGTGAIPQDQRVLFSLRDEKKSMEETNAKLSAAKTQLLLQPVSRYNTLIFEIGLPTALIIFCAFYWYQLIG